MTPGQASGFLAARLDPDMLMPFPVHGYVFHMSDGRGDRLDVICLIRVSGMPAPWHDLCRTYV